MEVQTKYNKSDEVWFMMEDKPYCSSPVGFKIECGYSGGATGMEWGSTAFPIVIMYSFKYTDHRIFYKKEDQLYYSKDELLKSL